MSPHQKQENSVSYHKEAIEALLSMSPEEHADVALLLTQRHGVTVGNQIDGSLTTEKVIKLFAVKHPKKFVAAVRDGSVGGLIGRVRHIYENRGKIQAIKELRIATGIGLADAKGQVEIWAQDYGWKRSDGVI